MEFLFTNQLASWEAFFVLLSLGIIGAVYAYDAYLFIARVIGLITPRQEYLKEKSVPVNLDEPKPLEIENPLLTESSAEELHTEEVITPSVIEENDSPMSLSENTPGDEASIPMEATQESENITLPEVSETPYDDTTYIGHTLSESTDEEGVISDSQNQSELPETPVSLSESIEPTISEIQEETSSVIETELNESELMATEIPPGETNESYQVREIDAAVPDIPENPESLLEGEKVESTLIEENIPETFATFDESSALSVEESTIEPEGEKEMTQPMEEEMIESSIVPEGEIVPEAVISPEEKGETIAIPQEEIRSEPSISDAISEVSTMRLATPAPVVNDVSNEKIAPEKRDKLVDIVSMVRTLIARGHLVEARTFIIEGLSLHKKHRDLNILLASLYEREYAFEKAEFIYKDIAEAYPNDTEILTRLADVLAMQRKYRVSYEIYKKILGLNGDNEETLYALTHLAAELKEDQELYEYSKSYIKQFPKNPEILWLYSQAQITLGKRREAIETLIKLKNLTPYNQEIVDLIQKLVTEEELAGNFGNA